jgi:hypothetical protein
VSPTHAEGNRITEDIRTQLRARHLLGEENHEVAELVPANLTLGQRHDPTSYQRGDVLVFHQNAKGYCKGQRVVVGDGPLPLDQAARFSVYHQDRLQLSVGDRVRITKNGSTRDGGHTLNNGDFFTVKSFTADGDLVFNNGWTVARDYGHLDHGLVVTSHASQGKTVDRVFVGQSSQSFAASSREQFYVSASRGREQVVIFTDDKDELLHAVERSDERLTGTELVEGLDAAWHRIARENTERSMEEKSVAVAQRQIEREGLDHER